jgi:hypothetical protein
MAVVSPEDSMALRATLTAVLCLGKVRSWPLPWQRSGRPSVWCCQFVDHSAVVDYYAVQGLLFGAEFYSQVYANTYGTRVEPSEHAITVDNGQGGD